MNIFQQIANTKIPRNNIFRQIAKTPVFSPLTGKRIEATISAAKQEKTLFKTVVDFLDRNIFQPLPFTLSPREKPEVMKDPTTGEIKVFEGLAPVDKLVTTRGFLKSPEDINFYTKNIAPIAMIAQLPARIGETFFRFAVQTYTNVASVIMGEAIETELPFDARRIAAKEQTIKSTGEKFFKRVFELQEQKKPETAWDIIKISAQATFDEVLPDLLDALIVGSLTDTAARQVLKFTKYDPLLERSLSELGIPKDLIFKMTTKEWNKQVVDILRSDISMQDKYQAIRAAYYVTKRFTTAGGPYQLTPIYQRLEDVAKRLIGIDAQVRAISPITGLPGYQQGGIGLTLEPLKGANVIKMQELLQKGVSIADIASRLKVSTAVINTTIVSVGKELLVKEALKYKSAEEFVKAIDDVKYKSVAKQEKDAGYKPYTLSKQEKGLLDTINQTRPIEGQRTTEDVKTYLKDIWNQAQVTPSVVREAAQITPTTVQPKTLIRETTGIIKPEMTAFKQRMTDYIRGIREGRIDIRTDTGVVMKEFEELLKTSGISTPDIAKFIPKIREIVTSKNPVEKFAAEYENIERRINSLIEFTEKRAIFKEIIKEIKTTKPKKIGARRVEKFDYETVKELKELKGISTLTKEEARSSMLSMPTENLTNFEKMKLRMLSIKGNGAKSSTELYRSVLDDLRTLKSVGLEAKSEQDFLRVVEERVAIDEAAQSISRIKADKKDLRTRFTKAYLRGIGNIGSILNAIGGQEFATKYDPQLAELAMETATFFKGKELISKSLEILEFKNKKELGNQFIDWAGEEYKITDIDNVVKEITKHDIMHMYLGLKNPKTKEMFYYAYGKDQIETLISNLSQKEMGFADNLQEVVQSYYPVINKFFIEQHGRDLGVVENYFPRKTEYEKYDDTFRVQSNLPSAVKERIKTTKAFPETESPWLLTIKHIEEAEHISHLSNKYLELSKLFKDRKIKNLIKEKWGQDLYEEIIGHVDNLALNQHIEKLDIVSRVWNTGLNNWVRAKIVSLSVFARQLGSVINYTERMPTVKWTSGFAEGISTPKKTFDYMWKNFPELEARFNRGYDEAVRDAVRDSTKLGLGMNSLTKGTSALVRTGDMTAIIYGGYPLFKYELELHGDLEKARRAFLNATLDSQQSGLKSSMSTLQNSANPMAKTFMRFKNTLNQYTRKLGDVLIQYHNKEATAGDVAKIFFIYQLYAGFIYIALGAGVNKLFSEAGEMIKGEEDDFDYKEFGSDVVEQILLQPYMSLPLIDELSTYAYRKVIGKKTYGYTFETPMIGDIWRAINKLAKVEPTFMDFLEAMSGLQEIGTGLGTNVMLRYYNLLFEKEEENLLIPKDDSMDMEFDFGFEDIDFGFENIDFE